MDIDLGISVPQFIAIWGMGWGACYALMYLPLKARVEALEKKQTDLFEKFQSMALKDR